MNLNEYQYLQSELSALQKLLNQLPKENVIERIGLQSRYDEIKAELDSHPVPPREPIHACLTFKGKPIIDNYGIGAEFGAKAVNAFADAIAAIGASRIGPVGTSGPLPQKESYQLIITGTALGSFGFELEEKPKDDMFPEVSAIEPVLEQAKAILKASMGTDDELTDAVTEVAYRAVESLRSFLKVLEDHEAVCSLQFKEDTVRFDNVEQVRKSNKRLQKDNIHEDDDTLYGKFLGFLPDSRDFEFQIAETDKIIKGKVSVGVENADAINSLLKKQVRIRVHTKRIGNVRPRYVLISYEDVKGSCKEEE